MKDKIYKIIIANDSKYYFSCLKKLVGKWNNTCDRSNGRKSIYVDYSALTEKIEWSHTETIFEIGWSWWVRITKYNKIFSKGYNKNFSRKILLIDTFLKTNLWTYKIKVLKAEKTIRNFYEQNCCWVSYKLVITQIQIVILELKSKYYWNCQIMLIKQIRQCYRCWYIFFSW